MGFGSPHSSGHWAANPSHPASPLRPRGGPARGHEEVPLPEREHGNDMRSFLTLEALHLQAKSPAEVNAAYKQFVPLTDAKTFAKELQGRFAAIDGNKDKAISSDELKLYAKNPALDSKGQMVAAMLGDKNNWQSFTSTAVQRGKLEKGEVDQFAISLDAAAAQRRHSESEKRGALIGSGIGLGGGALIAFASCYITQEYRGRVFAMGMAAGCALLGGAGYLIGGSRADGTTDFWQKTIRKNMNYLQI